MRFPAKIGLFQLLFAAAAMALTVPFVFAFVVNVTIPNTVDMGIGQVGLSLEAPLINQTSDGTGAKMNITLVNVTSPAAVYVLKAPDGSLTQLSPLVTTEVPLSVPGSWILKVTGQGVGQGQLLVDISTVNASLFNVTRV